VVFTPSKFHNHNILGFVKKDNFEDYANKSSNRKYRYMEIIHGFRSIKKPVITKIYTVFSTTIPSTDNISLALLNAIKSFLKLKHKFTE
jgi:hypothetical protein